MKMWLTVLVALLIASAIIPVHAETTINVTVDGALLITYEFKDLNQTVYDQARTQFTANKVPEAIVSTLQQKNQTVQWGLPPEPLVFEDASRTIRSSFFLGGSRIVSLSIDKTQFKRTYEVKTDWRRFKVDLTDTYSIDFAQYVGTPVAEWKKPDETTFFFENPETEAEHVAFYIKVPASASGVRASGDTVFFDMPPTLEDQLLYSPFPVLAALAVILVIILLYRRVR